MLEAAARDVRYEVNHLFRAHAIHAQIGVEDEDERHLIFEGLLIHFRNMLDFFFGQPSASDDIHAADFLPESDHWTPITPEWVRAYRGRCNKLLAHLTYSRIEYGRKGEMEWQLDDKLIAIRTTWNEFLAALPDHRAAWFR